MRKIQLFKLSCTLFSISIGSFIWWLGRITDCHNGSGTRDSWSWSSSNFYHEDTMDLSYTDTSFHPIYSLQGISQSVLEVTIEMKQKTLFKYYYLLLWIMNYIILLLWIMKGYVLQSMQTWWRFWAALLFSVFLRCTYFYLLTCYFIICLFFICLQVLISFFSETKQAVSFFDVLFCCCLVVVHSFLWCCFCYGLFICCFGLSRLHPFFPKWSLISLKRLLERVALTWAN